jgi:hypothetical protein
LRLLLKKKEEEEGRSVGSNEKQMWWIQSILPIQVLMAA